MNYPSTTDKKLIALVGNPNVGKSVFFHYLSKVYVDVSNYPGTTVEITSATFGNENENTLIQDTPGIYGVSSFNDEEKVARDIILYSDIVLNITSATSLDRDLFLTKQLIDMGKSLILVINQMDEAKAIGLEIDTKKLSKSLGIPVLTTTAIAQEGMKEVKDSIYPISTSIAKKGNTDPVLQNQLTELLPQVSNQAEALLLLEGDLVIAERYKIAPRNKRAELYNQRRKEVNEIIKEVTSYKNKKERFLTKISNILIEPIWGTIIAAFIAYLFLYQLLGIWVGSYLIDFTEGKIMNAYYEPFVKETTGQIFPVEVKRDYKIFVFQNGFLKDKEQYNTLIQDRQINKNIKDEYFFGPSDYIENTDNTETKTYLKNDLYSGIGTILSGKYGILTLTVTYLLGLLFPLVLAFYAALAVLEDSGYLPRLAVLIDGLLSRIGMNGRAIIPLILGLGCVTMASVTTRLLSTKREKIIAMTILGFAIPCSAQLGVIQTLLARSGGLSSWLIWISILGAVLVLTGYVMNKFLPGKATPLLIDLPPLRIPKLKNIFYKTRTKVGFFMTEAVGAFILAAFIVACMQITGVLQRIIVLFEPISMNLLHLPKEVSISFILGMVRRDFGAFGLTELSMTPAQVTVASVVLTLFVPCIATVSVMAKEQSWKVAAGIWVSSIVLAVSIGSVLAIILNA